MQSAEPHADRAGRIGIMGGTFDPIHCAHLLLAEQAREQLGLTRVVFIPSARPPHKLSDHVTAPEDRYEMTRLAIESNRHFELSRREIDRVGPSYTILTIRELAAEGYGDIYFITGADSVLEMLTWRQPDDILREAHVVTAARPGFDIGGLARTLGQERTGMITVLDCPLMNISSTDIRGRVADGKSIRYLVPEPVEAYIREHGLYRSPSHGAQT